MIGGSGQGEQITANKIPGIRAALCNDLYTARLTVDITPALRGRIKIAAFQRGETVADMLRDLLAREFPDADGERS